MKYRRVVYRSVKNSLAMTTDLFLSTMAAKSAREGKMAKSETVAPPCFCHCHRRLHRHRSVNYLLFKEVPQSAITSEVILLT